MRLSPPALERFYRLHKALMLFTNQRLKVIPNPLATPAEFAILAPERRVKVRNALTANLELIESFASENPANLTADELATVRSWRHLLNGKFLVFRQLKKHAVFLSTGSPAVAYGVLALSDPFEELCGSNLPVLVETVLLPFEGAIVYDGLMSSYNMSFGPGIRRNLNEDYREAKARFGIVTSLPMSSEPLPPKQPRLKPVPKPAPNPPTKLVKDASLEAVIERTDQFCKEHLNEEYAMLCRKLAEKLSRKRPSPLLGGNLDAWASGIVRAIGGVNYLHDKSQTPYMRATDIDAYFGISASSGATKSAAIRKMVRMYPGDHHWTLPSQLANNSLVWIVEVRGMPVDVRLAPREVQEIAFKKGLIPYIPADRLEGR